MTLTSVVAPIAGFILMAFVVGAGSWLIQAVMRRPMRSADVPATSQQLAIDFLLGMAAAAAGGALAVYLAPASPLLHALVLAAMVLAMSIVCLIRPGEGVPRWYMVALTLASAAVISAIGWMFDRNG